jgi:hypothetical protein
MMCHDDSMTHQNEREKALTNHSCTALIFKASKNNFLKLRTNLKNKKLVASVTQV